MNHIFGILWRKRGVVFLLWLFTAVSPCIGVHAESLWDSDFKGYIVDGSGVGIGAALVVRITPSAQLNLTTAHIDSNQGRLSFSGGEGSGLFDFLPEVSTSINREIEENSSYELETSLSARVTARDESGFLYLEGERNISINGNAESLRIGGWFSPSQVSSDGTIQFDVLNNSILEYTSPGLDADQVLLDDDLIRSVAEAEAPEAAADESGTAEATAAAEPQAADTAKVTPSPQSSYTLSDEKKLELLLQYFNRFLATVFTD